MREYYKPPIINMEKTGKNIRQMRKHNDLTVNDLRNVLGFADVTAIYRWEEGRTLPSVDNLVILADVFGCLADDIIIRE